MISYSTAKNVFIKSLITNEEFGEDSSSILLVKIRFSHDTI